MTERKRKLSSTNVLREKYIGKTTASPPNSCKKQRNSSIRTIVRNERRDGLVVVTEEGQSCRQKSKNKYANKYEPDLPMEPDGVSAWRRAARKKRNRESAERSRNKVRNRILELEDQVQDYKDRYQSVIARIQKTEELLRNKDKDLLVDGVEQYSVVSPIASSMKSNPCSFLPHSDLKSKMISSLPLPSLIEPEVDTVEEKEYTVIKMNDSNGPREVELDHPVIEITTRPA